MIVIYVYIKLELKFEIMRKINLIQVMLLALLTSCGIPFSEVTDPGYYQFTPNDLSHFYIDKDSLSFTENFYYKDSVIFLLNSKDTIYAEVKTYVHYWPSDNQYRPNPLVGISTINFNEQTGFLVFECLVSKNSVGEYSSKRIEVGISNADQYYSNYLSNVTDTATVLDSIYHDVYKLNFNESSTNNIKSIYFAKKFGFIKVERFNGKKMELIRLCHKGVYYQANNDWLF